MEQGHLCHVSTSLGPAQTALSHRHPALCGGPESFSGSLSQPAKSRGLWGVDSVSPSASFQDVSTEVPGSAWVPAMPSGSQPMQTFLGDLRQDLDPSVFTHLYNGNHTDLTNSPASRGSKTIFKVLLVTCHPSRCSQIAGLAFPHFSDFLHLCLKFRLVVHSIWNAFPADFPGTHPSIRSLSAPHFKLCPVSLAGLLPSCLSLLSERGS